MPLRPHQKVIEHITVADFAKVATEPLKLTLVSGGGDENLRRQIKDKSINRPGMALTGYFKSFASKRVQVFGAGEMSYLRDIGPESTSEIMRRFVEREVPCMIVSRNLVPPRSMIETAETSGTPLYRSPINTRDLANAATILLEQEFAPRVSEHGTLMDIRGMGVLIRGKSGVGKSECALALIERGHSLVADDLVHIRLLNDRELVGNGSELNRGYMECRGLGIINIATLFGVRAVRLEKVINLVVTFELWKEGMVEERTGLEQDSFEILGQKVPHVVLPVRPGRDLARLVEVASMVQALRLLGHDSAKEFNERLIQAMVTPA